MHKFSPKVNITREADLPKRITFVDLLIQEHKNMTMALDGYKWADRLSAEEQRHQTECLSRLPLIKRLAAEYGVPL